MKHPLWAFGVLAIWGALCAPSYAQTPMSPCVRSSVSGSCQPVTATFGLPVNVIAGGGTGGTASNFSAVFPGQGTAVGLYDGTNMVSWLTALPLGDGVNGNNTGAIAPWLWNGVTYDRWYGDKTNGAWVNIKSNALGFAQGSTTSGQLGQLVQSAVTTAAPTYVDGTTRPLSLSTNGSLRVALTNAPFSVTQSTSPWVTAEAGASFTNITTNTDTNVKANAGTVVGLVVNTGGTTSTAKIYNDADGTCNTGLIATIDTTSRISLTYNAAAGTGICVTTAGVAAADITILWR